MEFSPQHRKKVAGGSCCVKTCSSKRYNNTNLSFHRVPRYGSAKIARTNFFNNVEYVDKRLEWLRILNVADDSRELLVCSLHFTAKDYHFPDVHTKLRILKKDAVPMPVNISKHKQAENLQRQERTQRRILKKIEEKTETKIEKISESISSSNTFTQEELQDDTAYSEINESNAFKTEPEHCDLDCEKRDLEIMECDSKMSIINEKLEEATTNVNSMMSDQNNAEKVCNNKCVQVSSGDLSVSFCAFIKSEKDLITMCNIKNFKILNELTNLMDEIYPRKKQRLLSTRESIILTTAKLKLDILFNALAILFNQVCVVTVRNICYDTVQKLSTILQSIISKVSKEEIERNMPKCFDKFRATTSVLDCTEIKIQKPKCLKCRIKFYSHYKGDVTVKFMTEVTPAGIITYVSEAFGGRASDKTIFNHSEILKNLESTRVMVDRGFLIDDECMQKRIQLIRPPFLKNQQQLSEEEALRNKEIACARVHIERMNQRIKQFQILNNKFPWFLINYIDDIFVICCGLANLGTPILADDKF